MAKQKNPRTIFTVKQIFGASVVRSASISRDDTIVWG